IGHDIADKAAFFPRKVIGRHKVVNVDLFVERSLIDVLNFHAEPAADDAPVFLELRDDFLDAVYGNGKADGLRVKHDGNVDTDSAAVNIEQRTAAVAEIDGRVGLNEVLKAQSFVRDREMFTAEPADVAEGERTRKTAGAPHGDGELANFEIVRIPQFDHG